MSNAYTVAHVIVHGYPPGPGHSILCRLNLAGHWELTTLGELVAAEQWEQVDRERAALLHAMAERISSCAWLSIGGLTTA